MGNNPLTRIDPFGLDWIYSQSTGQLMYQPSDELGGGPPQIVDTGYAGHNLGLNNPDYQSVPQTNPTFSSNAGPLPQGIYKIGNEQLNVTGTGTQLPFSMRLTPYPSNNMFGRAGFLIHGGNMNTQSSSQGCVVLPKETRDIIGNSGDKVLRVVQ